MNPDGQVNLSQAQMIGAVISTLLPR